MPVKGLPQFTPAEHQTSSARGSTCMHAGQETSARVRGQVQHGIAERRAEALPLPRPPRLLLPPLPLLLTANCCPSTMDQHVRMDGACMLRVLGHHARGPWPRERLHKLCEHADSELHHASPLIRPTRGRGTLRPAFTTATALPAAV